MRRQVKMYGLSLAAVLLAASPQAEAQLLKGFIRAESEPDMQISYTLDGDILSTVYQAVTPAADGSFTFDMPLPEQTLDVTVGVENEIFGVHLERGKQAVICITEVGEGKFDAKFEGDNVATSRVYNTYVQAFDIMKYFSIDPAESKPIAEYRRILEEEYAKVKAVLPLLTDEASRNLYTRRAEGMYKWTKIRILMDQAYEEKKKLSEYPEYNELIASIDPNNTENICTNLTVAWLTGQQPMIYEGDQTNYYMESMNIVERDITNPIVRRMLTRFIGYSYFSYGTGDGSGVKRFWERYKEFAKEYPDLLAQYEVKVSSITETTAGSEVPYNPLLTCTDGTTCRLSDLYGKLLYIDVWATWCGPCCKEIPYLEKLVEQFAGNDKVRFISISVDHNREAWLKKLKADNPAWEQYILTSEEEKEFMSRWGIGGIPRFILLDKEGRIVLADAPRPSDEKLIKIIEEQTAE